MTGWGSGDHRSTTRGARPRKLPLAGPAPSAATLTDQAGAPGRALVFVPRVGLVYGRHRGRTPPAAQLPLILATVGRLVDGPGGARAGFAVPLLALTATAALTWSSRHSLTANRADAARSSGATGADASRDNAPVADAPGADAPVAAEGLRGG